MGREGPAPHRTAPHTAPHRTPHRTTHRVGHRGSIDSCEHRAGGRPQNALTEYQPLCCVCCVCAVCVLCRCCVCAVSVLCLCCACGVLWGGGCTEPSPLLATALSTVAVAMLAFGDSGYWAAYIDISPEYAGVMLGLVSE